MTKYVSSSVRLYNHPPSPHPPSEVNWQSVFYSPSFKLCWRRLIPPPPSFTPEKPCDPLKILPPLKIITGPLVIFFHPKRIYI